LYYCESRYYDPELGRWLSIDSYNYLDPSSANGSNLYAYCVNNPVMYLDSDGNSPTWWNPFSWSNETKIIIGAAFIVVGLIATVATGGALAPALLATIKTVATSVVISAAVGTAAGGISAAISGEEVWQGMLKGAIDGAVDGFMWGGIASGTGNILKSIARSQWGQRSINMTKNSKNWLFGNKGGDLTIFRNGRNFRIDYGVSNGLHYHVRLAGGIGNIENL
uniref:RHS repeat-associated core domain-containing protein n=1 Tax=Haploplasma modicum TaxID=2150 RepID=UPI00047AC0DC